MWQTQAKEDKDLEAYNQGEQEWNDYKDRAKALLDEWIAARMHVQGTSLGLSEPFMDWAHQHIQRMIGIGLHEEEIHQFLYKLQGLWIEETGQDMYEDIEGPSVGTLSGYYEGSDEYIDFASGKGTGTGTEAEAAQGGGGGGNILEQGLEEVEGWVKGLFD